MNDTTIDTINLQLEAIDAMSMQEFETQVMTTFHDNTACRADLQHWIDNRYDIAALKQVQFLLGNYVKAGKLEDTAGLIPWCDIFRMILTIHARPTT